MSLKKKLIIAAVTPFALVGAMAVAGLVMIAAEGPTETTTASAPTSPPVTQTPPPAPRLSLSDRASKIQTGMTMSEVVSIMGSNGKREITSATGGFKMEYYSWGSIFTTYVTVVFMNGQVSNVTTM